MANNANSKWDREEIGALWKKTSKKGTIYLTGKVNGEPVMIFTNQKKKDNPSEHPTAPDYRVYEGNAPTDGGQAQARTGGYQRPAQRPQREAQPAAAVEDDAGF